MIMLVYDEPTRDTQTPAKASLAAGPTLATIIATLWRYRYTILIAGAVGGLFAMTFGELSSPRYTATAQLYIDPRDLRIVNRELTPVGQDSNAYMTIVESQTRVITSRSVLDRVVNMAKLDRDTEFAGQSEGLLGSLMVRLGLRAPMAAQQPGSISAVVGALEKRITIRRAERTFIVDVSVWASSPDKAAAIANAIADAYLAEDSESRTGVARRATASLTGRLEELRERVREAETRVEQYKARNNLVGTRDALVSDQQLTEMNQQLGAARARTAQARARYDQMMQAKRAGTIDGAMTEALNSQTMATLRGQHAELRRRQAELTNTLGPLHPAVKSIEVQVRDLERLIQSEIARFVESARNELETARANESSLERSLDNLKRRTMEGSQATVQLRELEREVEASRGVYEAFLVRARETGEQERLNTTNARVISPASAPQFRSFPPRVSLLTLVGLFAGLLLGGGIALLREWLRINMPTVSGTPHSPARRVETEQPSPAERPAFRAPAAMPAATRAHGDDIVRWTRQPKGGFPQTSR